MIAASTHNDRPCTPRDPPQYAATAARRANPICRRLAGTALALFLADFGVRFIPAVVYIFATKASFSCDPVLILCASGSGEGMNHENDFGTDRGRNLGCSHLCGTMQGREGQVHKMPSGGSCDP